MKRIPSYHPSRCDREEWLSSIIQQYALLVEKTVRRTACGQLNNPDVEEVVSDVFYAVWKASDRYDRHKGSMASFIMAIARHKTVDRMRRRGRETTLPLDESISVSGMKGEGEQAALFAESRATLLRAIADLGEPDATIILRRYYLGESYREIAKRVRMTENAVNKRCLNALKKLKQRFEED